MLDEQPNDLGNGFSYKFFEWSPDRELNPQYDGIPDVEKAGILIYYNGKVEGSCWFDIPEVRAIQKIGAGQATWQLLSLEPLHIEPSIQMYRFDWETKQTIPAHHGYIRNGKWESA